MKTALIVFGVLAALAILLFVLSRVRGPSPEALFVVTFDDVNITVTAPNAETRSVAWNSLTRVGIRTTDEGPWQPDVFWGFHTGSQKAAAVFPGGATGEQELIKALTDRLPGFNDKELIRAMGSTSNAYFVLWEAKK